TRKPKVLAGQGETIAETGWTIAIFLCKLRRDSSGAVKNRPRMFLVVMGRCPVDLTPRRDGQEWT
ncbi:hypothetical protein NL318_28530, partial [Klebsiella pneumoniae]|nr:hypothetical protein [Klebsiella pneumoniae]